MARYDAGGPGRRASRRSMVHVVENQVEGAEQFFDGTNRGEDQGASWEGSLGGVLDASVEYLQRGVGRHGRVRHHGGAMILLYLRYR